jgi:hypothetical protein
VKNKIEIILKKILNKKEKSTMVFYIVACNEDGKSEEDIKRKITE